MLGVGVEESSKSWWAAGASTIARSPGEIGRFNLAVLSRDTYAMFRHFTSSIYGLPLGSRSFDVPAPASAAKDFCFNFKLRTTSASVPAAASRLATAAVNACVHTKRRDARAHETEQNATHLLPEELVAFQFASCSS